MRPRYGRQPQRCNRTPQRVIFVVENEPIPAFRHKNLLQLVQEGRTEAVFDYLESIGAGIIG